MDSTEIQFDILIIGGGPVGTTAATLLSEKGYSVCLLEKAKHPRFHIGESLLPMNLPILERLGVLEQIKEIGIIKYGAEFNALDPVTQQWKQETFYFEKSFNKKYSYAYEVRRSEFDSILFENCKNKGVTVLENHKVIQVEFYLPGHVIVSHKEQNKEPEKLYGRYVIDA